MPASEPCARCGRDPAAGYASIIRDGKERWYCHGASRPSCYEQASWEGAPRLSEVLDGLIRDLDPAS